MAHQTHHLVEVVGAGGDEVRGVVGHGRRTAHTALADQVLPGLARLGNVDAVAEHQRFASLERRGGGGEAHQEVLAAPLVRRSVLVVVGILVGLVVLGRQGARTIGGEDDVLEVGDIGGFVLDPQQVVPHHLDARLGNRERDAAVATLQRLAVVLGLALGGVLRRVVIHVLRRHSGAVSRVDVDAEAVRVLLQQRLGAFGELVGVLRHVLRGDLHDPLLAGERLHRDVADLGAGGGHALRAGPGRDAAVLVGGLLAAQRGEVALQRRCFFRAHCSVRALGTHQYGSQRCPQSRFLVHCYSPRLGDIPTQKVRWIDIETKSRSP